VTAYGWPRATASVLTRQLIRARSNAIATFRVGLTGRVVLGKLASSELSWRGMGGAGPSQRMLAGVIEDARRRQRRRRWFVLATLVGALAAALGFALGSHGPRGDRFAGVRWPAAPSVTSAKVLATPPYLGVNCPAANSIACDRVGLEVLLRRPAVSVRATIAGWPLGLSYRGDVPASFHKPRTEFDGFLQPAGIVRHLHVRPEAGAPGMWYGDVREPWPTPLVRLLIDYGHGRRVITQLPVSLATGWS
jgi:hypothetical protein